MNSKTAEMRAVAQCKKELLRELHEKAIPWVKAKGIRSMALLGWPPRLPADAEIWSYPMEPLPSPRSGWSFETKAEWPQVAMKSVRHPFVAFILEGEADFRVVKTPSRRGSRDFPSVGCQVLSAREGDSILFPPGVPHDDRCSHWFRPKLERAYSRILSIEAIASGGLCHICTTRGREHFINLVFFVPDLQLNPLLSLLIDELNQRLSGYEMAAQAILLAFLIRVERALATMPSYVTHSDNQNLLPLADLSGADVVAQSEAPAVQRARKHIEMNLGSKLSLEQISRSAFVSTSYLSRLFEAELSMPVMRYVTQCRIDTAKTLLTETDLPVSVIARTVGYSTPTNFSRVFRVWTGANPIEHRKTTRLQIGKKRLVSIRKDSK